MPFHLIKGIKTLYYYGNIFYNIEELPNEYNNKLDLYFNCDCHYPEWKNIERVIKK